MYSPITRVPSHQVDPPYKYYKRISNLENGNNNDANNNEKYFYMIENFQIPYEDYILLNKSYDYF